jgi:hypothetical protein
VQAFSKHQTFTESQLSALERISREDKIVQPPLMSILPETIAFPFYDQTVLVEQTREDIELVFARTTHVGENGSDPFIMYAEDAPDDYFILIGKLSEIAWGMGFQSEKRKAIRQAMFDFLYTVPTSPSGLVSELDDFHDLLAGVLRRYLSTKKPEALTFLRNSMFLMLAYDTQGKLDKDLLIGFSSLALPGQRAGAERQLISRRSFLRRQIYEPHLRRFIRLCRDKVTATRTPVNLKTNILGLLGELQRDPNPEKIKERFLRLMALFKEKITADEFRKIHDTVMNLIEKVNSFELFFTKRFPVADVHQFFHMFSSHIERRSPRTITTETAISKTSYIQGYPTKDLHDFLKGYYSRDCSLGNTALAEGHLLSPRFFNIRLFQQKRWFGNIYMLDYSDRGAVIIDRIQISNIPDWANPDFIAVMAGILAETCGNKGKLEVLGSEIISNYKYIQEHYQSAMEKKAKKAFLLDPGDGAVFECASRPFYVLSGRPES